MHVPFWRAKYAIVGGNALYGVGILAWHDHLLDAEAEAAWLQRDGCPCYIVPAIGGKLSKKNRVAVNALMEGVLRSSTPAVSPR